MNDHTYKYLITDAEQSIRQRNLGAAMASLNGASMLLKDVRSQNDLEQLRSSYAMMLTYFEQGASDPSRGEQYERFLKRCEEICSRLQWVGMAQGSGHFASLHKEVCSRFGEALSISEVPELRTVAPKDLFDLICVAGPFSTDDTKTLMGLLSAQEVALDSRCMAVSALTLSCLTFFDEQKLRILVNEAHSMDVALQVRALVGLVLVVVTHSERIGRLPELSARLQLMLDEGEYVAHLEEIQMQFLLTLDTKRIDKRLNEEIIPRIFKRLKDRKFDESLNLADLDADLADSDLNPQWGGKMAKDEELKNYMKDFMSLQSRGADLYMGAFRNLKTRLRFFDTAANWFSPFSLNHPDLPAESRKSPFTAMMLKAEGLCDTDKFAFCFMSDMFPAEQRKAMQQKLPEGMVEAAMSDMEERGNTDFRSYDFKHAMRAYIQDFYRFFQLFTYRSDFTNPFQHELMLCDVPAFADAFSQREKIERLADYVFDDHSYQLAHHLFSMIPQKQRSAQCWQKMGYCMEFLKQTEEAVTCYGQAIRIQPQSEWALRRLAMCLRRVGKYAEAELHLMELETLCPDDTEVAMLLAECFIHEKIFDEAFKRLFKADYLQPDSPKAKRALAWCSLLSGKFEQAERHYAAILANEHLRTPSDFLNAGHTAWLLGDVKKAVERYRQAKGLMNRKTEVQRGHGAAQAEEKAQGGASARVLFEDDADFLCSMGKTSDVLQMMADLVDGGYAEERE